MTVRNFLLSIGFATGISWVAIGLVIWGVDPYTAGVFGHLLFYSALFFALFGTASLLGFAGRMIALRDVVPFRHIGASMRQGILLSTLVTASLLMLGNDLLKWWNGTLLFASLVIFEGFFQLTRIKRR